MSIGFLIKLPAWHENSSSNWMNQRLRTDASCFQVTFNIGSLADGYVMVISNIKEKKISIFQSQSTSVVPLQEINPQSPKKRRTSSPRHLSLSSSLQRPTKMTHVALHNNHLLKRLLLQFRVLSRKRRRNLSHHRLLFSLTENLLWAFTLLLPNSSSRLLSLSSRRLIPTKLLFKPSRQYLHSNSR